MQGKRKRGKSGASLPVIEEALPTPRPRRNFARWRALSLSLVYVVFAAHIIHWKVTGKTLAPLELNEVMYTLELGIITAGFLFMCFLVLGTLIFGRFFCSWACHIMVLQDLCAWVLQKLKIKQKPIRSRLLLLVPPLTAAYMFIWPQILRAWSSGALPEFHFRSDREGWASFVTENFWRNLPNAPIIVLTFVVCGFAIVYIMGTRTFCTYVCPYGAIFALADRFSPGRIRVTEDCVQCGTCTAACTSGVRVHEEVDRHGIIVNPACMKDLDCVSACPEGALHYEFTKPALFASYKSGGRFGRMPYDFSLWEEILIAGVFVVCLLTFRGLYSRVPFLLSLGLGAILGYLSVMMVRLLSRSNVTVARLRLKAQGRVTAAGRMYGVVIALLAVLVGHSAFVRYHEFTGLKQAEAFDREPAGQARDALAASSYRHLLTADRLGLIRNERVERNVVRVSSHLTHFEDASTYASRMTERHPWDANAHFLLGQSLAAQGNFTAAMDALAEAVRLDPERAAAHAALGSALAEVGRIDEAVDRLGEAVRLDPELGRAHYNLGTLLAYQTRFEDAIASYRQALGTEAEDAELHNNLGLALMQTGRFEESQRHLESAVSLDPSYANAQFNLGVLLTNRGQAQRASRHFEIAIGLDPRYADLLEPTP